MVGRLPTAGWTWIAALACCAGLPGQHEELIAVLGEQTTRGAAARHLGGGGSDAARAMGRWLARPRSWSAADQRRGRRVLEILTDMQGEAVSAAPSVVAALPSLPNGLVHHAVNALAELAPWWPDAPESLDLDERLTAMRRQESAPWRLINLLGESTSRYSVRSALGPGLNSLDRALPELSSGSLLLKELALDSVAAAGAIASSAKVLDACLAILARPSAPRRIPWQVDARRIVTVSANPGDVLCLKAARAILSIAPDRPDLVQAYHIVVREGPAFERCAALFAIGHAAGGDGESVRVLLEVLDESDPAPVRAAVEALTMIGAGGDDVVAALEKTRLRADEELAAVVRAALRGARR